MLPQHEQNYYKDIRSIKKSLERIAVALERLPEKLAKDISAEPVNELRVESMDGETTDYKPVRGKYHWGASDDMEFVCEFPDAMSASAYLQNMDDDDVREYITVKVPDGSVRLFRALKHGFKDYLDEEAF